MPPATGFDTGTGYAEPSYPKRPRPPEPVFETKGPLRWASRRNKNDDWIAYDGFGRQVYLAGRPSDGGNRYQLHWAPSGTVWDDTHSFMGGHYRSIDDAKATAEEDHQGRSGGKGYR